LSAAGYEGFLEAMPGKGGLYLEADSPTFFIEHLIQFRDRNWFAFVSPL